MLCEGGSDESGIATLAVWPCKRILDQVIQALCFDQESKSSMQQEDRRDSKKIDFRKRGPTAAVKENHCMERVTSNKSVVY
jgi:hypothetical protein